ncbi:hypothetical protein MVEN_01152100 [Mycena venus]|uniref:Secreted protein n=1 Tax=Mycena venus TaxID=2733690 RepID=A0A8H6Y4T1_9AGAR|nr:hypothetical protein MVEN_01152100 [Mycena venus]
MALLPTIISILLVIAPGVVLAREPTSNGTAATGRCRPYSLLGPQWFADTLQNFLASSVGVQEIIVTFWPLAFSYHPLSFLEGDSSQFLPIDCALIAHPGTASLTWQFSLSARDDTIFHRFVGFVKLGMPKMENAGRLVFAEYFTPPERTGIVDRPQ